MFEGKINSDGMPEWTESEFRKAYENEWTPPDEGMLWVVAGTMKQASLFARKHRIYPPKWRMVSEAKQLTGVEGSVVYVGSYYERSDIEEIREVVSICEQAGRLKVIEPDE